ncbi:MAG TPA: hypothetical protein DEP84_12100, partial [Chloroflexi bacterium]|nr:hypothetical protein [Chloroflexota bacterium]
MESSTFLSGTTVPAGAVEVEPTSLGAALEGVRDRRQRRGVRYQVAVVVTVMILAKLAGEQTMSGIAQWARWREWLGEGLKLSRPTLPCANSSTLIRDQGEVEELNTVWVIISRPRRRHRVGRPALQATRLGAGV